MVSIKMAKGGVAAVTKTEVQIQYINFISQQNASEGAMCKMTALRVQRMRRLTSWLYVLGRGSVFVTCRVVDSKETLLPANASSRANELH